MTDIYHKIVNAAESGTVVALATVLKTDGSVPRKCGAKMLVFPDGSTFGTVGGGTMEADVAVSAQQVCGTGESVIRQYDFNPQKPDSLNLVCGGNMEILIEYIGCSDAEKLFYGSIGKSLTEGIRIKLFKKIEQHNGRLTVTRAIADEQSCTSDIHKYSYADSVITEIISPPSAVYIVGAGHVGRETARFAKRVGFSVTVMDDRAEYADAVIFPDADRLVTVMDYKNLFSQENINDYSYIVIATRGHEHDMDALESALRTGAGYIGMMGSKKKKATIFAKLAETGFSEKDINRVSSPIGLEIGAETPEEIALSIVAEMVRHRTRHR